MSQLPLRIQVHGVRGSYSPTQLESTAIGVNTSCISAQVGDHTIIFDAGSGIINLGNMLVDRVGANGSVSQTHRLHMFLTHMHIDHLEGFPYFQPIYRQDFDIHFFSPRILYWSLEKVLATLVSPPFFPLDFEELPFQRRFNLIKENMQIFFYREDYQISGVENNAREDWLLKISCMRNFLHPKGGSFFYKLQTPSGQRIVLAYDTEGFIGGDQRLIQFANGADLLMHDAQYTESQYQNYQGYGHSTYMMACEVAQKAGVKKLLLTHHDPSNTDETLFDIESKSRKLFPETYLAREDMTFDF